MYYTIILFLVLLMELYIAGRFRGMFESILIFDTLKYWMGKNYSRDVFFNGYKDSNGDGRVSYWELTFPRDGGHSVKRWEVIALSFAMGVAAAFAKELFLFILRMDDTVNRITVYDLWFLVPVFVAAACFLTYSLGFRHAINKYRRYPDEKHLHPDYPADPY